MKILILLLLDNIFEINILIYFKLIINTYIKETIILIIFAAAAKMFYTNFL